MRSRRRDRPKARGRAVPAGDLALLDGPPDYADAFEIRVAELEASSPLVRAVLVAREVDPSCVVFTTMLRYTRPLPARAVWAVVAPVHRRVARYLLAGAASRS